MKTLLMKTFNSNTERLNQLKTYHQSTVYKILIQKNQISDARDANGNKYNVIHNN